MHLQYAPSTESMYGKLRIILVEAHLGSMSQTENIESNQDNTNEKKKKQNSETSEHEHPSGCGCGH